MLFKFSQEPPYNNIRIIKMKDQIGFRRQQFKKDIRRNQIESFMTECRSKLIDKWQQNVQIDQCIFLNSIYPPEQSNFYKLKIFLLEITSGGLVKPQQMSQLGNNVSKINTILTSPEGTTFYIGKNRVDLSQIKIEQHQITSAFLVLSRQICSQIADINKLIQSINKPQTPLPDIENLMTYICNICKDFKEIIRCLNTILESYAHFLVNFKNANIRKELLKAATSCLIELSCFKPRKYTNNHNLQIVNHFNLAMKELKQILNTVTITNLIVIAKEVGLQEFDSKIITNIIYIFGNAFISLSASDSSGICLQQELHMLVFAIFTHIFQMLQRQNIDQTQLKKDFAQLASLMVWFIRNQILITEGMYQTHNNSKSNAFQTEKQVDIKWIQICFFILAYFYLQHQPQGRSDISEQNVSTICAIISLLKLLRNDFNLHTKYIWNAFKLFYPLTKNLKIEKPHHKLLQQNIYDFYVDFLSIKFVDDSFFSFSQEISEQNLFNCIQSQIFQILQRQNFTPSSLRLCTKMVVSYPDDKKKYKIYLQICNCLDLILKSVNRIKKYEQAKECLLLAHSIIELFQIWSQKTEMKDELLSNETIKSVFSLCQIIWQSDKNDEDMIQTLSLLKTISENEHFSNHIKSVILSEGYQEQLENLSALVNQDLNRLVYQIYQLLELE